MYGWYASVQGVLEIVITIQLYDVIYVDETVAQYPSLPHLLNLSCCA